MEEKPNRCKEVLTEWNEFIFDNIKQKIKKAEEAVGNILLIEERKKLREIIRDLQWKEEVMWW